LYEQAFECSKDELKSKKFSKKISRLIKKYESPTDFNKVMNEQLKDKDFSHKVLVEALNEYSPNHNLNLDEIEYDIEFLDDKHFKIHTNIDFETNLQIKADTSILPLINWNSFSSCSKRLHFILDALGKKWKPNHFIENDFRALVNPRCDNDIYSSS